MYEKHKTCDPVERLDEIVAELDRLYAEADHIIDGYELSQAGKRTPPKALKCH
jgi:hypothetical protein